jgi:hypothetical protein
VSSVTNVNNVLVGRMKVGNVPRKRIPRLPNTNGLYIVDCVLHRLFDSALPALKSMLRLAARNCYPVTNDCSDLLNLGALIVFPVVKLGVLQKHNTQAHYDACSEIACAMIYHLLCFPGSRWQLVKEHGRRRQSIPGVGLESRRGKYCFLTTIASRIKLTFNFFIGMAQLATASICR